MRKLLAVLTVIMLLITLAACGGAPAANTPAADAPATDAPATDAPASDAPADDDPIQVAYVSALLTNEIFAMQVRAMEAYCAEIGVEFLNTPAETDPQKISAVENYIQAGVDVIICHVSTPDAMVDSMKAAQAAGIKFFAYDTPVEGCDAYFGWDNFDYGYSIGANAAEWVNANFADGETCNAFSLNYPSADFLVVRESGYKAALDELCEGKVNWAGEAQGGSSANGVTAGENWLQSGIDINMVVGINDAGVLGTFEAFNAADLGGEKVGLFAGDATVDALNAMQQENSTYRGTVLTGLESYADEFVDIAVRLANGEEEFYYFGGLWFVTPENVAAYAASGSPDDLDKYSDYYTKTSDEFWAEQA